MKTNNLKVIFLSLVFGLANGFGANCLLEIANGQQNNTRQQADFPAASPESQGMSSESLGMFADTVQGYVDRGLVVGAELLVIKNRRTVFHKSFGWRDRDSEIPMGKDTIFNVRSMTKPLTGAAIQILIDRGDLKLDDLASKYVEGFDIDKSKKITIRHLLTHRSGLPLTVFTISPRQFKSLQAIANAAGETGPEFPVDSKFWYSDAGADVLAAIVEKISGMPIDEFWQQEVLSPLSPAPIQKPAGDCKCGGRNRT